MALDLSDVKQIKQEAEDEYHRCANYSENVNETEYFNKEVEEVEGISDAENDVNEKKEVSDAKSDGIECIVVIPSIPGYEGSCNTRTYDSKTLQSPGDVQREEATILDSNKQAFTCFHCSFIARTVEQLKLHIVSHVANLENMHQTSNYCTTEAIDLRKTINIVNTENLYDIESEEKPFKCPVCSYKSSRIYNVKNHMKIHSGERPYKCSICTYKSTEKSALKAHLRIHSEEKPFVCNVCNYKTARMSSLKCHVRKHTGEKPYACKMCDYRAKWKSTLKKHMRNHSSDVSFICNICSYRAATANVLSQHIKIHSGLKQHVCNICKYTTTKMSNLKRHTRIHIGEKFNAVLSGNNLLDKVRT